MNKLLHLVAPFLLATVCVAQGQPKELPKHPFVLEAGEIDLTALIDRCAAYLDCNILVSPTDMAAHGGSTSFRLQKTVTTDRDGCVEFLTTILTRSGFALSWLDDKQTIGDVISMIGPRARELMTRSQHVPLEQVLRRPNLKMPITTVVPLKHINATVASNALRPFFASTGAPAGGMSLTLGNVGNNRSMVLSGMQDQVAQAIQMLRVCDVPPPPDQTPPSALERIDALELRVKELEKKVSPEPEAKSK